MIGHLARAKGVGNLRGRYCGIYLFGVYFRTLKVEWNIEQNLFHGVKSVNVGDTRCYIS